MPEPKLDADVYIQMIRFKIDPERRRALTDAIFGEVERWVAGCDGFISANFHISDDGGTVINYAQWRDEAAFDGFLNHPEHGALGDAIDGASPDSMEADRFVLARTFLPK